VLLAITARARVPAQPELGAVSGSASSQRFQEREQFVSNAGDVARFYRALLGGRLVRPDLLALMTTPALSADVGYGAGLEKIDSPCGPAWGHSGATPGFTSHAYEDRDRQIVLLYNLDYDALSAHAHRADRRLMVAAFCG
jgi:D-alanyl-D-alanine carboxypeptidase